MGRTTKYTPEIAAAICERIANGEPLRAICRDEAMPAWQTVYDWIARDEDLARRIAHAREIGFDAIAEHALEIADTPVEGVKRKETEDGVEITHEDMLGHRKLQVETRLKLLAKWCPKKYGDKQTLEHTGPDNGPVQVEHKATALASILSAAAARKAKVEEDIEGLV